MLVRVKSLVDDDELLSLFIGDIDEPDNDDSGDDDVNDSVFNVLVRFLMLMER